MLDWNGNGRIDPTDIGVSMSVFEESEGEDRRKRQKPGCLVSVLAFAAALAVSALLLFC